MAEQALFTFQDAVDHIMDVYDISGLDVSSKHFRSAKRAVDNAYRDMARLHEWSYYERSGQIRTSATQTSSTVTYDHSGGVYERMLTLAAGTWPIDAARGHVIMENLRYKVSTRETSTIITLTPDTNPGSDMAAGTGYQWFRALYPLPVIFRKMSPLFDVDNAWELDIIPPEAVTGSLVGNYQPSEPVGFSIRNQGDYYGGLSVEILPPPIIARTYDYSGVYEPRALTTYKYNTGTVSVSGTTVTGVGTTFADVHIGDVMRFGGATEPSGLYGSPDTTIGDNPYVAQRIILAVGSMTTATIDASVSATVSGAKYTISSPLDIPTSDMANLFHRLCESYYLDLNPRVDGVRQRNEKKQEVQQALMLAMRADNHTREATSHGPYFWVDRALAGDRNTGAVISGI